MSEIKFDYDSNIKYLTENSIDEKIENSIALQDKILSSDNFNKSFQYIEDSLNYLYEKQRMLQDVIDYTNLYLRTEINNTIKDCKTLMASIEKDRDLVKNNSYVKYNVPLMLSTVNAVDRDNTVISTSEVYAGTITLANSTLNNYNIDIAEINRFNSSNNIDSTLENLIHSRSYRTFYMFKGPQSSPIVEKLTLKFNTPCKVNKINMNTSNCKIKNINLTLEDNTIVPIENSDFGLIKSQYVKEIEIEIQCTNYIISQVNYKETNNSDFWTLVNEVNTDDNLIVNKDRYYYYLFGIDNLSIEYVNINKESCFYSKDITIDSLKDNEYITIDTEESVENGSIEYYIMDGTELIPILPEGQSKIIDERIFYKMSTRFTIDATKDIVIKKNGDIVNITLQEAINKNEEDAIYTVSYTPVTSNINSLANKQIKIKAIIRNYDDNYITFIKSIDIKKYGGGKAWIDQY